MGVEIYYTGDRDIPEEKREILAKQMEKVLNYGGMMTYDTAKRSGCSLHLLKPFRLNPREKYNYFYYNYFEDCSCEGGSFYRQEGTLFTGKVGILGEESLDTCLAAWVLLSMYDKNPGCVAPMGVPQARSRVVGWLNHLLGTRFSMAQYFDLFKNAENFFLRFRGDEKEEEDVLDMIPVGMEYEACSTDFADLMYIFHGTASLDQEDIVPGSYADDVRQAREAIRSFLNREEEDPLETLWTFLKSDREKRMEMTELSPLPELSLILPARVFVYLASERQELDFWKLWNDLRKQVYQDQEMKSYVPKSLEKARREMAERPVRPVRTSIYLRQTYGFVFPSRYEEMKGVPVYYLSDDDRLYWWDPDSDEVILSSEADRWLKDLSLRHRAILESLKGKPLKPRAFRKKFLDVLIGVSNGYRYVYPFKRMFREFIRHSRKKEYVAALELYKELAAENWKIGKVAGEIEENYWLLASRTERCNPGRMAMKRYLSVMANRKLRKRYFGF